MTEELEDKIMKLQKSVTNLKKGVLILVIALGVLTFMLLRFNSIDPENRLTALEVRSEAQDNWNECALRTTLCPWVPPNYIQVRQSDD